MMALTAVLYSLTAGERQEDMKLYCDRSFEVRPAPAALAVAALAVAAQQQDPVNSIFWYNIFGLKKAPSLESRNVSYCYPGPTLLGTYAVPLPVIYRRQHALRNSCLF